MVFKKNCLKCGKSFQPSGKFQKQCDECRYPNKNSLDIQKKSYFKHKIELNKLRDDITLKRWKILSHAYKQGKKIWGSKFTRERLSHDMDIPMTTTLRCLSLDKANKSSWDLVKEKKISVYKLAMVTQSKNVTYQDEIVKMIIEDSLSTYQITTLKVGCMKDVNKERQRIACEKGYSRRSSAYINFKNWAERGIIFLKMDESHLPENKIEELRDKLKKLNKNIETYLK
jgi:hypothetical protein